MKQEKIIVPKKNHNQFYFSKIIRRYSMNDDKKTKITLHRCKIPNTYYENVITVVILLVS